jgi:hypothetical protein
LPENWSETYATADVIAYDGQSRVKVGRELPIWTRFAPRWTSSDTTCLLQALHPRRVEDTLLPPAALGLARGIRRVRFAQQVAGALAAVLVLVGAGAFGWKAQSYVRTIHEPASVVAVFPTTPAPAAVSQATSPATPAAIQTAPLPSGEAGAPPHLGGRISVHPPNLQTVGYQLVDGRADITAYGPVLRFAYEPLDQKGGRLALTVAGFGADRQSLATNINPQHTSLFWQDGKNLFALSGAVEPSRLLKLADVVAAERARMVEPIEAVPAAPVAPVTVPAPLEEPAATPAAVEAPKET